LKAEFWKALIEHQSEFRIFRIELKASSVKGIGKCLLRVCRIFRIELKAIPTLLYSWGALPGESFE
jgi:hypothetical protein